MRIPLLLAVLAPLFAPAPKAAEDKNPIDAYFQRHWKEKKIRSARRTNDYEFLRRLSQDLTGQLPTPDQIRSFAADRSKDKREKKINELLKSKAASRFWADQWMRILFNYRFEETDPAKISFPNFAQWLQKAYETDMPYDQFARHLIADRGDYKKKPATNYILKHLIPDELPVQLTARVTKVFLGVQIQCAQCHDHPTEAWTQENFWGITAFFSGVKAKRRRTFEGISTKLWERGAKQIKIPDTDTRIGAQFLDGKKPRDKKRPGDALADFFVQFKDHQFAKALVNRMWAHFMGKGFVEPLDRFGDNTKPSHPQLLETLAKRFIADGYSIHKLFSLILNSRVYQARCETRGRVPDTAHARMLLKPQNPVQLLNTLIHSLRLDTFLDKFYQGFMKSKNLPEGYRNKEVFRLFLHTFMQKLLAPGGRAPEERKYAGSLRLALRLMNNNDLQGLMSVHWGRLKEIMKLDTPEERIEEIFLTLLSRPPKSTERARYRNYIRKKRGSPRAYEDLYWVLMNSTEFFFIH